MKIACFASSFLPSLAANSIQVMKMCEAFAENGHQVELFARRGLPALSHDQLLASYGIKADFGINLIEAPSRWFVGGMLYGWRAARCLKELNCKPDLLYGRNIYALLFSATTGIDFCYEAHAAPDNPGRKLLERRLFALPGCRCLVVINNALRDWYLLNYPEIARNKHLEIVVAPDGAASANRSAAPGPTASDKPVIGYAGGLYPGKGIERIAEVAAAIPEFSFIIAGGTNDEVASWQQRCGTNVTFTGYLQPAAVENFLYGCDILLAPYQHRVTTTPKGDGNIAPWMSPLKIFEYMASHRPIIASRLPAIEEILRDHHNALLVNPEDNAAWCSAIRRLAANPTLRQTLADQASVDLISSYTWKTRAENLLNKIHTEKTNKFCQVPQNEKIFPCPGIPNQKPWKCLHIIGNLSAGGAEKMLCRLVTTSDQNVIRHCIVTLLPPGELAPNLEKAGIRVFSLMMNRRRPDPVAIFRLCRLIRRIAPDIVHTWLYHADLIGGLAAAFAGAIPVICSIRHGSLINDPLKTVISAHIAALIARFVAVRVISCSERAAQAHIRIGYPAQRVQIIPNGFELPQKPETLARSVVRQSLGIPESCPMIGLIGRFNPAKDHENFFRAAAIVAKHYPEAHFILCGVGVDANNAFLNQVIASAGIQSNTHLLGHRHAIAEIISSLTMLVSSSVSEAFPNVIGEAMSLAIPCVVTDAGESASLIGDAGFVMPTANAEALADGILRMLRLSAHDRAAMGNAGRRRIESFFTLAAVVKQYENMYLEVADEYQRK